MIKKNIYTMAYIKRSSEWEDPMDKIMPIINEKGRLITYKKKWKAVAYAEEFKRETGLKCIILEGTISEKQLSYCDTD